MLLLNEHREFPPVLWHYTTGDGLVGIICNGKLFATHVSCLNDTKEHRHLPNLILGELELRRAGATPFVLQAIEAIEAGFLQRNAEKDSGFVTCLSEVSDDLGQWRGYGGGTCGFAIGFDTKRLLEKIGSRAQRFLMRMRYKKSEHRRLAATAVTQLLSIPPHFGQGYFDEYGDFLNTVVAIVKHHKFKSEKEYRFLTRLLPEETGALQFRQKQTLLARYLAVDFTIDGKLPIQAICIGPGPAQSVSQTSVADLLRSKGYEDVKLLRSKVPYRVP
jgi:hypothetical protein